MNAPNELLSAVRQDKRRLKIESAFDGFWVTIFQYDGIEGERWFCALLDKSKAKEALKRSDWDLHPEEVRPQLISYSNSDKYTYKKYARDGIEPLVFERSIGNDDLIVELAEDFRLYFNLFYNDEGNLYRNVNNHHNEVVVKITKTKIEVQKSLLLKYISVRQKYLALYFDHISRFPELFENPLPEDEQEVSYNSLDRCWIFGSCADYDCLMSGLQGKILIKPEPIKKMLSKLERKFVEFIVGCDESGNEIEYSCDPSGLSNRFGKNPDAPDFLKWICFRKEVLDKYYHNPGQFSVSDGVVRSQNGWLLRMDNDHKEVVLVHLGDLGRDLPYEEQLYWRSQNIIPQASASKTAFARDFKAMAADSEQPEHQFKIEYEQLQDEWLEKYGWNLFRPLSEGDNYLLDKLHVPSSDNPAELDSQIIALSKILVNSINSVELLKFCNEKIDAGMSIAVLEAFFLHTSYQTKDRDIKLLRNIQSLRSSGSAHSKGGEYKKHLKKIGFEGKSATFIINELIVQSLQMLRTLRGYLKGLPC